MKFALLAIASLALVAGCTNTSNESPTTHTAATAAATKKVPPTAQTFAYSRLPDKAVKFSMPIAFKSQRLTVNTAGGVRSLLEVRYYKTATSDVWSSLDKSFAAAGYTASALSVDHKQHERHAYKKAGKHTITISLVPDKAPETRGTLWIGWHAATLAHAAKAKPAAK